MSQEEVKLLTAWPTPFGMRAHIALELKGIKYDIHPQDFQNKSKLLLDSNPVHKKIPVLIHNGKPIAESSIILHYVDETWPEKAPFFPSDPFERSQQRFWGDFVDKKILESMMRYLRATEEDVVKSLDSTLDISTEDAKAAANKDFYESLMTVEDGLAKKSAKGPFFGGESMGFADIMIAPFYLWSSAVSELLGLGIPTPDQAPHLNKLFAAVAEQPAVKAVFPESDKLKEFIVGRIPFWRGQS